jgi:hypothetical protein
VVLIKKNKKDKHEEKNGLIVCAMFQAMIITVCRTCTGIGLNF